VSFHNFLKKKPSTFNSGGFFIEDENADQDKQINRLRDSKPAYSVVVL